MFGSSGFYFQEWLYKYGTIGDIAPVAFLSQDAVSSRSGINVTVAWGKLQVGLVVDRLIGKQEIVIKALGSFIGSVPWLSGCTILGDGCIALISDISSLIGAYLQAQKQEIVE
ncbi:MAG: hypothetical protein GY832_45480 [Chloroflexi bacterium]|nr:hypothetical protein [Chloroflexota bacterium]